MKRRFRTLQDWYDWRDAGFPALGRMELASAAEHVAWACGQPEGAGERYVKKALARRARADKPKTLALAAGASEFEIKTMAGADPDLRDLWIA